MSAILSVYNEDSGSIENLTLTITDCVFCGQGGTVLSLDPSQKNLLDTGKASFEDLLPEDLDDSSKELLNSNSHEDCWVNAW